MSHKAYGSCAHYLSIREICYSFALPLLGRGPVARCQGDGRLTLDAWPSSCGCRGRNRRPRGWWWMCRPMPQQSGSFRNKWLAIPSVGWPIRCVTDGVLLFINVKHVLLARVTSSWSNIYLADRSSCVWNAVEWCCCFYDVRTVSRWREWPRRPRNWLGRCTGTTICAQTCKSVKITLLNYIQRPCHSPRPPRNLFHVICIGLHRRVAANKKKKGKKKVGGTAEEQKKKTTILLYK